MLSPQQLHDMTGEQRTQLFDQLCRAYYGTASYVPQASRDLEVARRTIFNWRERNDVPLIALATIEGWANRGALKESVAFDYTEVAEQLSAASVHFRQASVALSRIARRLPVLTDGAASDAGEPQDGDGSEQSPGEHTTTETQAEA